MTAEVAAARARARRRLPLGIAAALGLASLATSGAMVRAVAELTTLRTPEQPPAERVTVVDLAEIPPPPPLPEEAPPEPSPEQLPKPPKPLPEPLRPEERPPPPPIEEEPPPVEEEPPPPEEEPPPPEPPPLLPPNMKMVEQLDETDEAEKPKDYEYLSNVNRDVEEQTRAELTNYEEDAKEIQAQQLELLEEPTPTVGTANDDRIAADSTQESQVAEEAPKVQTSDEELRPEQDAPAPRDQLTAKDQAEIAPVEAQEEVEDLAKETEAGDLAAAQEEQSSVAPVDKQSSSDRRDDKYSFRLSAQDMAAVYGKDRDALRDVVSEKMTHKKGVWEDARAHWQSPLENMVPEVQPGNQTALRSAKHPFARYVTAMHRDIHELWADGYLASLDVQPSSSSLNDFKLWSRVEIVIARDGRVEKVTTVRTSGNTAFDAAAREVVWSSGPWPDPPKEIRSGNGKVYVHWSFHRDERACGTFGATPFILDNAGQGDRPDPEAEIMLGGKGIEPERRLGLTGGREGPQRLASGRAPGAGHSHGEGGHAGHEHAHEGHGHGGHGHGGGATPGSVAGGSAGRGSGSGATRPPPGARGGGGGALSLGGRGGSTRGPSSASGVGSAGAAGAGASVSRGSGSPSTGDASVGAEGGVDPAAETIAKVWTRLLRAKDLDRLVASSGLPFRAGDRVVARTREDLLVVLAEVIAEHEGVKIGEPTVHTAADLRKRLGALPAGVQEGSGRLHAIVRVDGDALVLILERSMGRWRVIGVTR